MSARLFEKHRLLFVASLLLHLAAPAQQGKPQGKYAVIDTMPFQDATHHWYDIFDKDNVVNPRPGQPRYAATQITEIADNILLYQKNNGGWPKNYDIRAIL